MLRNVLFPDGALEDPSLLLGHDKTRAFREALAVRIGCNMQRRRIESAAEVLRTLAERSPAFRDVLQRRLAAARPAVRPVPHR